VPSCSSRLYRAAEEVEAEEEAAMEAAAAEAVVVAGAVL
jgi:hypothetical protein